MRGLSSGEWRRVQLARALYRRHKPPQVGGGAKERAAMAGRQAMTCMRASCAWRLLLGVCAQLVVLDEPTLLMSDQEAMRFMARLRDVQVGGEWRVGPRWVREVMWGGGREGVTLARACVAW